MLEVWRVDMMKRLLAIMMCLVVLTIAAMPAGAQTRYRTRRAQASQQVGHDYDRYRDDRSVWDKHRDKITTAGGAVGGALLGGLVGGKKGALIGAIAGGGGAAVYTYEVRERGRGY
jgi:outer membrane lipoprotein SlyB